MTTHEDVRRQRVLATVDSIPRGRVATYGGVAAEAGLPRNARYVGRVLRELPMAHALPWHRVLGAGGVIRVTGAAARRQAQLLRAEGVEVRTGRVDLRRFGWPVTADPKAEHEKRSAAAPSQFPGPRRSRKNS
jgi:methylated-DNA-protein-cysteine methyltransferase-like protein